MTEDGSEWLIAELLAALEELYLSCEGHGDAYEEASKDARIVMAKAKKWLAIK